MTECELPLLNAQQVAKLLNVKPSTVYEWARIGYIPQVRMDPGQKQQSVRFYGSEISRWVKREGIKGEIKSNTGRIP